MPPEAAAATLRRALVPDLKGCVPRDALAAARPAFWAPFWAPLWPFCTPRGDLSIAVAAAAAAGVAAHVMAPAS